MANRSGMGLLKTKRTTAVVPRRRWVTEGKAMRLEWLVGMVLLHVMLGVLCKQSKWVATAHALVTLAFGIWLALTSRAQFRLACWAAYVVGAEVLWRMAQSATPWEYAKFALSLVLLIGLVRNPPTKAPWSPVLYLLLLLPAVVPTLVTLPLQEVRKPLSFYLSGPLSVAVCALFFSGVQLDDGRMQRLMAWLIFPITAIAAAVLLGLSTTQVVFNRESSFGATGGFGPNQVSAILGLAGLFALLLASDFRRNVGFRVAFLALALWFAAHAALSFSRTGLYLLGSGLLAALPFLALKHLLRPKNIAIAGLAVLSGIAIWGFMVRYTGGMISQRFAETQMSNRGHIANQDVEIWQQHPLLGIGLGLSSVARSEADGDRVASHTEYTRLLAEHGLFGLLAGVLLFSMWFRPFRVRLQAFTKAAIMACLTWALLSLAVSAMRTAAPAFLIGLAFAGPVQPRRGLIRSGKRLLLPSPLQASLDGSAAPLTVGFQSVNSHGSLPSPPSAMHGPYPGP